MYNYEINAFKCANVHTSFGYPNSRKFNFKRSLKTKLRHGRLLCQIPGLRNTIPSALWPSVWVNFQVNPQKWGCEGP